MNLYRISGPYDYCVPYTKCFASDDDALDECAAMVDGPGMPIIEKWFGGDWFHWDRTDERWIYNPNASKEKVEHRSISI